jgi:hypothetical protein
MGITYNTRKDLPSEQLHKLFMSVGWSDGTETTFMLKNFNMPFINSTIVISTWENDCLVGTIQKTSGYYEKIGFKVEHGVFLSLSSK